MKNLTKDQRKEVAGFLRERLGDFADYVTSGRTRERGEDWDRMRERVYEELDTMIRERLESE